MAIIKVILTFVLGFIAYALISTGWNLLVVENVVQAAIVYLVGGVLCAWLAITVFCA
jgi:hypothetical protein